VTIPGYAPNTTLTGVSNSQGADTSFTQTTLDIQNALKNHPNILYSTADNWNLAAMYPDGIPAALENVNVAGVPAFSSEVPSVAYVGGKLTAMFGLEKANYINSLTGDGSGYLAIPPKLMPPLCVNMVIADTAAVQPSLYAAQLGYKEGVVFSNKAVEQSGLSSNAIALLQKGVIPEESIRFIVRSASGGVVVEKNYPGWEDAVKKAKLKVISQDEYTHTIADYKSVVYMFVATYKTAFGESTPSSVLIVGPIDSFDSIILDVETPIPDYVRAVRYYMAYSSTGLDDSDLVTTNLKKGFLFPDSGVQNIGNLVGQYLQWNGSSLDGTPNTCGEFALLQEVPI
jgi:hypothetical protein